jgi:hypothetical protein
MARYSNWRVRRPSDSYLPRSLTSLSIDDSQMRFSDASRLSEKDSGNKRRSMDFDIKRKN